MANAARPGPRDLAEDRDPWERQPGESEKAWAAFVEYRDAGEGRSLSAVARKLGKWRNGLQKYARQWRWAERVEALDRSIDEDRIRETRKATREMRQRHAALAKGSLAVLQRPVVELMQRLQDRRIDLTKLPDGKLIDLVLRASPAIREMVAIERVAMGLPGAAVSREDDGSGDKAKRPATMAEAVDQLWRSLQEGEGDGPDPTEPIDSADTIEAEVVRARALGPPKNGHVVDGSDIVDDDDEGGGEA